MKGQVNYVVLNWMGLQGVETFRLKSTQSKKLVPNALWFTDQSLKSCKPHEKSKQKTSKC